MNKLSNILLFILIALGILFITLAILIDLVSLYLNLQRVKKRYGPSGIPILSLFIYLILMFLGCSNIIRNRYMYESLITILIAILLICLHICFHFIFPLLYAKWIYRKK